MIIACEHSVGQFKDNKDHSHLPRWEGFDRIRRAVIEKKIRALYDPEVEDNVALATDASQKRTRLEFSK